MKALPRDDAAWEELPSNIKEEDEQLEHNSSTSHDSPVVDDVRSVIAAAERKQERANAAPGKVLADLPTKKVLGDLQKVFVFPRGRKAAQRHEKKGMARK